MFSQILSGLKLLQEGCLSKKLREAMAVFVAAALPERIMQIISLQSQRSGEVATVGDITLEHMNLLDSKHLEVLRDFIFMHIALRFPLLHAFRVPISGNTDLVSNTSSGGS